MDKKSSLSKIYTKVKQDNNTGTVPLQEDTLEKFKDAYTTCPTGAIKRKNTPFTEK